MVMPKQTSSDWLAGHGQHYAVAFIIATIILIIIFLISNWVLFSRKTKYQNIYPQGGRSLRGFFNKLIAISTKLRQTLTNYINK